MTLELEETRKFIENYISFTEKLSEDQVKYDP